jgi:hypothetical protein
MHAREPRVRYGLTSTARHNCDLAFSSGFFWTTFPSASTSRTRPLTLDLRRRSSGLPSQDQRWLAFSSVFSSHWMIWPPSSLEFS